MNLETDIGGVVEHSIGRQPLSHLLRGAQIRVGGHEQLIEAEPRGVVADEAIGLGPQRGFGQCTQLGKVPGIGDDGCARSQDPRLDPLGQLAEVGVDDRQLHLVEGRAPDSPEGAAGFGRA